MQLKKKRSPHSRFYRQIGKENNLCLQGRDCVCQLPASAQLCVPSHPHIPWEWKWKPLLWALQDKWVPGESFCQYLAGASSCSTAAVKHECSEPAQPSWHWLNRYLWAGLGFFFALGSFSFWASEHSSVKHEIAWPWSSSLDWWDP